MDITNNDTDKELDVAPVLLDFDRDFDVEVFDEVVNTFYTSCGQEVLRFELSLANCIQRWFNVDKANGCTSSFGAVP